MISTTMPTTTLGTAKAGVSTAPDGGMVPNTWGLSGAGIAAADIATVWSDGLATTRLFASDLDDAVRTSGVHPLFTGAELGIPSNAVISKVRATLSGNGSIRLAGGASIDWIRIPDRQIGVVVTEAQLAASPFVENPIQEHSIDFTTNVGGNPWTSNNLAAEAIGILIHPTNTFAIADFQAGELSLVVFFQPQAPTVSTSLANNVTFSSAQFNAAVNPNGATNQFPVTLDFLYGTDPSNLNLVTGSGPVTGSSEIQSGVVALNLVNNTTYYYRARVRYDGGTVVLASNIQSVTTISGNEIMRVF